MKSNWILLLTILLIGLGRSSICFAQTSGVGELEELLAKIRDGQAKLREWELEIPAYQAEREFTARGKTDKSQIKSFHHQQATLIEIGNRRFCLRANEVFGVEKARKGNQYALLFQTSTKADDYFQSIVGKSQLLFFPLTAAVQSSSVLDVLSRDGFRAESMTRDGPDLVTLHYSRPLPNQGENVVDRGILTFSISNHYLLTRFESRLPLQEGERSRMFSCIMNRTFTSQAGKPVVTEVTQVLASTPTHVGDNTTKIRYRSLEQGAMPEEFQFTHYIASPPVLDVYEDRPTFNWPIWVGLGVACIVISVVLAWVVRRKRL
ncbi:hypothetical protein [Tuwongella immobilis]|nr:hypothetical protein [Tuwongella immobilis]